MPRHVLLFDLDGTLVDSAQGIAVALNRLRLERGLAPLPVSAVRPLVALGVETLVGKALGVAVTTPAQDVAAFRAYLRQVPNDPAMIYPGVQSALAALTRTGSRVAVVTNKPCELARALLEDLDLMRWVETVIGGDSAPLPKPAADPVLLALAQMGVPAADALFIGDSGIDAAAARATAIPFLLFTGGYGAADCPLQDVKATFEQFQQLPNIVASINLSSELDVKKNSNKA